MSSLASKAAIAAPAALLFLVLNTPLAYQLTNALLPAATAVERCPTAWGIVLHSMIFFLVTFLTMRGPTPSRIKAERSLTATLLYFALSSQELYTLTGNACPAWGQILLHALLYFAALVGVMYL